MSGTGPESVPVSADPRSKRPTKKRALTPVSAQASQLDNLFKRPDQDIRIPTGETKKRLPLPPEIVTNVQGSSAGAGSGEFHVYKAARRREYERLRVMDEEVRKEEEQLKFEERRRDAEEEDRRKTERNRVKREKMKARKEKAKSAKNPAGGKAAQGADGGTGGGVKARVVPSKEHNAAGDSGMDVDSKSDDTTKTTMADVSGLVIHEDD